MCDRQSVPPAGFEPAHPAPEAGALSPELRGPQAESSNGPSRAFRAEIAGDHRYAPHAMTHAPASRVLVVDDDPVIVRLLEVNFRLEGFEVDTASRGDEALRQAAASHPDVVVLDVMMPGIDGWEVVKRLRENPTLALTPIVLLSARAQDDDRARGHELGALDYVTKPFDPAQLLEVVKRRLATREDP